jgi:hypothetical protein
MIVNAVFKPALAPLVNRILPLFSATTKLCVTGELLTIPKALRVSVNAGLAVTVYGFAPPAKMIPFTSTSADSTGELIDDDWNVAVSAGLFGGPPAVQFVVVFQSALGGLASHVAELAKAELEVSISPATAKR